jgi:hypothetical protein
MIWQVVAVWMIVIPTVVWFVRDERHRRQQAVLERAARFYAEAPQYRHVRVEGDRPVPKPQRAQASSRLKPAEKRFLSELSSRAVLVVD